MFGRKKDADVATAAPASPQQDHSESDDALAPSVTRRTTPLPPRPAAASPAAPVEPARRAPAPPQPARSTGTAPSSQVEGRKLVVGRDIHLRGEVTSCETLIVEGSVDLTLTDARHINVMASGVFVGPVDVEEADIAGRFEGDLTARERLIVRSGGHVAGKVRYANIVIEAGGQITGEIGHLEAKAAPAPAKQEPEAESRSPSPASQPGPIRADVAPMGAARPAETAKAPERAGGRPTKPTQASVLSG